MNKIGLTWAFVVVAAAGVYHLIDKADGKQIYHQTGKLYACKPYFTDKVMQHKTNALLCVELTK